jgi:hypothetical protein
MAAHPNVFVRSAVRYSGVVFLVYATLLPPSSNIQNILKRALPSNMHVNSILEGTNHVHRLTKKMCTVVVVRYFLRSFTFDILSGAKNCIFRYLMDHLMPRWRDNDFELHRAFIQ